MHEIDTYVFGQHDPGNPPPPHGENQFGVDVYRRPQRKVYNTENINK
jgi:hypothetical protein